MRSSQPRASRSATLSAASPASASEDRYSSSGPVQRGGELDGEHVEVGRAKPQLAEQQPDVPP